ncbi:MAG TPA: cation:proton antiporter [Gaiellaceae bacterium]|nr:cation:proton antiporter [Gaiellaceae bacterium]
MHDLTSFGLDVLLFAAALSAALLGSKVSARASVPSAALFLVVAAVASDAYPSLSLSTKAVEQLGTIALIVILFNGGSSIGLRRFRVVALPVATLGILGTFATAGLIAVFVHVAFGLGWTTSGLLGAAIAPTDPAVMFSVLGDREIGGAAGTILEGESGANDPVGIALMIGMIELATRADASFWIVVQTFVEQMAIGLAIGVVGGLVEQQLLQRLSLPSSGLHTVRTLALAGLVYGVATVAHGSGFLAVFIAGLLVGDIEAPFKSEIAAFQDGLATLAEIVVFVALGLTIEIGGVGGGHWAQGIALAAFVALVARPLALGPLLGPTTLRRGEVLFVMWGGLKGAVPILLAAFALGRHVPEAQRIYDIVFVVVLVSVVVQGSSISWVARRAGIEVRGAPPVTPPA